MRTISLTSLAMTILVAAACGGDDGGGGGGGTPDGGGGGGTPDGSITPPADGFQIVTTDVTIPAGGEETWCYFFQTPNTGELGITRWESAMTPGSHHMIVYFTDQAAGTPGTLEEGCGSLSQIWTYASQTPTQTFQMPDGVGMTVPPGQYGFIEMHYLNVTDEPLAAHVTLNGVAFAPGVPYTKAAAYVTYNTNINIPPGTPQQPATATATGSCDVSPAAKFFTLSTHAHKRAVRTEVRDGASMVFQSTDWEHPGSMDWSTEPFYSFTSGKIDYRCDYSNPEARTVRTGNSAETDEMCMAVGYFFPATGPKMCLNSTVVR